jgi:hypothetical protein
LRQLANKDQGRTSLASAKVLRASGRRNPR